MRRAGRRTVFGLPATPHKKIAGSDTPTLLCLSNPSRTQARYQEPANTKEVSLKVFTLPVSEQRSHEVRAALDVSGNAVNELLRRAVVEARAARSRVPASPAGTVHSRAMTAYLESISVILDKPGLDEVLSESIRAGIFDIRKLAATARNWDGPEGPEPKAA